MAGRSRTTRRRTKNSKRPHPKAIAAAKHSHADAGPDRIVCLLCGEEFRAISFSHLRFKHDFDGEHPVEDYKARFGLRVASCSETCESKREVQVRRFRRLGRHWTRTRIVFEIRRRASEDKPLSRTHAPPALVDAACRMFGKWDAALRAAGLDPMEHRLMGVWNEARLVEEMHQLASRRERLSSKWVLDNRPDLHGAATRIAGNWTSALRRAGLDPAEHHAPPKYTVDDAATWVRQRTRAGKPHTAQHAPLHLRSCVRLKAGSGWAEFVESLGIAYQGRVRRTDWTDDLVIKEIKARYRRRRPMNLQAVMSDAGQALTHQARKHFGSWDAALEAAGMDPAKIRQNRVWTRDDVIAGIRARQAAGRSLRRIDAYVDEPRLVQAAVREVSTSWYEAVEAAGLDPAPARAGAARKPRARRRGHK